MSPTSASSPAHAAARPAEAVFDRVLLVLAFLLVSAVPLVPQAQLAWLSLPSIAIVLFAAARSEPRVTVLCLFCGIAVTVNWFLPIGLRRWPWHLLLPLALWLAITWAVPMLRPGLPRWPWGGWSRGTVILSVVTVVGSGIALVAWYILLEPDVSHLRAQVPAWPLPLLILGGLGFSVVNAFLEEAIWRWILWDLLAMVIPSVALVIGLQAVSFGLIHIHGFPHGAVGVAMAVLYGVFLGIIRRMARGLAAPVAAHVAADVVIFAILAGMP